MIIIIGLIVLTLVVLIYIFYDYNKVDSDGDGMELENVYPILYSEKNYKGKYLILIPNNEIEITNKNNWIAKSIKFPKKSTLDIILRYDNGQFKVKDYEFREDIKDLELFFNTQLPNGLTNYLEIKDLKNNLSLRTIKVDTVDLGDNVAINCSVSGWSEWSECCDNDINKLEDDPFIQIRERTVLQEPNEYGEKCPINMKETKECDKMKCIANCEVSEWSEWSQCKDKKQDRNRTILVEPRYGGKFCPSLYEVRSC